jgi:hypothetical protein
MYCEHCRDKGAAPEIARHFAEQNKEQEHGSCVKQNVREMMPACLQSKQLAIYHVRNGGKWMPIERMAVRERPNDSRQRHTACDDRISVNVSSIVEINEIVAKRLPEHGPRNRDQEKADPKKRLAISSNV